MKIARFTEEQIIAAIRSQVSGEKTVERVSGDFGISATTFFRGAFPWGANGSRNMAG
jgi:hypothetical protein